MKASDTNQALAVLKKTGGRPVRIGEDALTEARIAMAAREGLYLETSAAAAVAAADSLRRDGTFRVTDRVVCVLTAGGLKDAPREGAQERTILHVPANLDGMLTTVREAEGLDLSEGM